MVACGWFPSIALNAAKPVPSGTGFYVDGRSGRLTLQFFSVVGVYWEDGLGKVFGFPLRLFGYFQRQNFISSVRLCSKMHVFPVALEHFSSRKISEDGALVACVSKGRCSGCLASRKKFGSSGETSACWLRLCIR